MGIRDRRVKRRLLRELVDENVELLSGRGASGRRGPAGALLRRTARLALLLATSAALFALFGSTLVISGAVPAGLPMASQGVEGGAPPAVTTTMPGADSGVAEGGSPVARSTGETGWSRGGGGPADGPDPVRTSERSTFARTAADLPAVFPDPEPIDASVFPLAVRRIVIDPGHGGPNLGTRIPGGVEEKFLTLDIGKKVAEALRSRGFEVILTRHDDTSITLQERAEMANRLRADIFVSIHVNWLKGSRDSGIETYFLGPTDDPFLTKLAARENRDSGHTLAELRDILDGIYAGVRHDKSQDLAEAIHRSLLGSLRRVNTALRDRGVKTAPFLVLVDTEMPAVLAEVAALSNAAEAEMLEKPLYREYIADSLAAGIISYAESLGTPPPEPPLEAGEAEAGGTTNARAAAP